MKPADPSQFAQWLLSLALPPDRAAAAVGDLLEEAATRGKLWFWSSVARTTLAHLRDDFIESPGLMVSLALRGCLYYVLLTLLSFLGFMLLNVPVSMAAVIFAHGKLPSGEQAVLNFLAYLVGIAILGFCAVRTGKWLARRAPGREITACLALAAIQPLLFLIVGVVTMSVWGSELEHFVATNPDYRGTSPALGYFPVNALFLTGLFFGALRARKSRQTSTPL